MITRKFRRLALLFVAATGFMFATTAAEADPSYRVARLSYESGSVSFSPGGESDWAQAVLNRPMINGDRIWVDASSRAELQLGGTSVRAGNQTSLSILNVDDRMAQLQLTQGALEIRVWRLDPEQVVEIDTPNLAYVIRQAGSYRIEVDPQDGSTGATVRSGAATLYGEGRAFRIGPADTWRFYDTQLADYDTYRASPADDLARFAQTRDQRSERSASARYVARDMIGFDDLDEYGTWRQERDYGWVWAPTRVARDWAPYRDGHWSWVEPWGWTWVDDAAWGFAPSHYGRWAHVDSGWFWVPGPANVRPVYAPALVAFVGGGLAVAAGSGGGLVGWFPLGPREVYRPSYVVSRDYFTRVNVSNTVVNVTQVVNVYETRRVTNAYANQRVQGAVVAVPMQAFVQARPVAREIVHVRAENVQAQSIVQAAPVVPAKQSVLGPQAAQHRPPEQLLHKQVVAQTQPPPPPASMEQKLPQLQQHPGQPVAPASAPARPQAPSAATPPAVKVVTPAQPAAAPPPPAPAPAASRAERERRSEQRHEERTTPPAAAGASAPQATARPALPSTPAPAAQGQSPAAVTPVTPPAAASAPGTRADERGRERPSLTPPRPAAPPAPAPQPGAPVPTAPTPSAAPVAPAPAASSPSMREQRQRTEERAVPQAPAPAQAPPAPRTAAPAPQAAPAPVAPATRAAETTQQRREQRDEQRQQREAPPPAPARAPAPQPAPQPQPAAPRPPAATAPAPQTPPAQPAPAQRAEERRERASEAREQRKQ